MQLSTLMWRGYTVQSKKKEKNDFVLQFMQQQLPIPRSHLTHVTTMIKGRLILETGTVLTGWKIQIW